ncbi:discoidin domain-containing protein [Haloferula sargassicola]|uniref:F5/8 type C domain-containing protein n=1 Tax=Haloferula sargassicola TaxID=490096 RepID=A0ABP9ULR9_9BACT
MIRNTSFHSRPAVLLLPLLGLTSLQAEAAYRYYRFDPFALAQGGTVIQLSEFQFFHNGSMLNLVADNLELSPKPAVGQDGTNTDMVPVIVTGGERATTDGEGALKIVDGSTSTKWLTSITADGGAARYLSFDFGSEVEIDGYNFATGGDTATFPNRNPISWRLEGSNDGTTWTILDRQLDYPTVAANSTFESGFTATGTFAPSIWAFELEPDSPLIVRDGEPVYFTWDTWDEDLDYPDEISIAPSISSQPLDTVDFDVAVRPPADADTTYTLTATKGGLSATRSLVVRSVVGGSASHPFYRFTPIATRNRVGEVQMSEFRFFHQGAALNLTAANAVPAQVTGSNGTDIDLVPVTVTNPGGSNDPNADNGAVRLVDGYTSEMPGGEGFVPSRFADAGGRPVVFEFNEAVTIDGYQFATTDGSINSDPVRWILEGSDDGTSWTLIDNVTAFDYPVTETRNADTQAFPLPGSSLKQDIVTVPPFTWTAETGDYATAANWSTGTVPGELDPVEIATGAATLNANLTRTATTAVSGEGSLTVNGRLINRGTLTVSGGTLTQAGNYFLVGSGGVGTLFHTGGRIVSTHDRGWFLSDNEAGAGSRYLMSGSAVLEVNSTGEGNTLYNVHLGKGGDGDLFRITGGSATFTSTADNNVWLSRASTFLVAGGTVNVVDYSSFTVGHEGTGGNLLHVTGGTLDLGSTPLRVGEGTDGAVVLEGGSLLCDQSVTVGTETAGGSFTMSGGTLEAADLTAGAMGTFEFTGGVITLQGDKSGLPGESWFTAVAGTQAVYSPGSDTTTISVGDGTPSEFAAWAASFSLTGALAEEDADHDGIANIVEFGLNGSPVTAASRGIHQVVKDGNEGVLTAAIRQGAVFSADGTSLVAEIDGVRYRVEASTNLVDWSAQVVEVVPAASDGVATPDGAWELRSFRLDGGGANGFIRIRISETP